MGRERDHVEKQSHSHTLPRLEPSRQAPRHPASRHPWRRHLHHPHVSFEAGRLPHASGSVTCVLVAVEAGKRSEASSIRPISPTGAIVPAHHRCCRGPGSCRRLSRGQRAGSERTEVISQLARGGTARTIRFCIGQGTRWLLNRCLLISPAAPQTISFSRSVTGRVRRATASSLPSIPY